MADQFDKQSNKENQRREERRHREFLDVVHKLGDGIDNLDARFAKLVEEGKMDAEQARVFQQIDRKTLRQIDLDEKFAKTFSASTLKQLDVLGSIQHLEHKANKNLTSINRSTGQNLTHTGKVIESFRNFFGLFPGRGARIRTAQAENAQIDQRNVLKSIRDINKRSLLTLIGLHKESSRRKLAGIEEKKEERRAREKSEKSLLKALGLLKPSDRERKQMVSPLTALTLAGGMIGFTEMFKDKEGFLGDLARIADTAFDFVRAFGSAFALSKMGPLFRFMKNVFVHGLDAFIKTMGTLAKPFNFVIDKLRAMTKGGGVMESISKFFKGNAAKGMTKITTFFQGISKFFNLPALTAALAINLEIFKQGKFAKTFMSGFQGIGRVFKFLKDFIEPAGKFISGLFGSGGLGSVARMGGAFLKALGKFFLPITIIFGVIDAVKGFMKGFEEGGFFAGIQGALTGILDGLLRPFAMIFDWIGEALGIGPIGTMVLDPLMEIIDGIFGVVIAPFKAIFNFVASAFGGDGPGGVAALFQGFFDMITGIPKAILNAVGKIFGAGALGDNIFGAIENFFKDNFGWVTDTIGFMVETLVNMIKGLFSLIGNAISGLMSFIGLSDELKAGKEEGKILATAQRKLMAKAHGTAEQRQRFVERGGFMHKSDMQLEEEFGLTPREIEELREMQDHFGGQAQMQMAIDELENAYLKALREGSTEEEALQVIADMGVSNDEEITALIARIENTGMQKQREAIEQGKHLLDKLEDSVSSATETAKESLDEAGDVATDALDAAKDITSDATQGAVNIVGTAMDTMPDLVEAGTASFIEASVKVRENLKEAINNFRESRGLGRLREVVKDVGNKAASAVGVPVAPTQANASPSDVDHATGRDRD